VDNQRSTQCVCDDITPRSKASPEPLLIPLQGDLLDVELLPGVKGRGGGVVVLRMRRPRDFSYR
jgi:hypothetical protein